MASFSIDFVKTTGTVTAQAVATVTVNADSEAAARKLATEQLADDASEIVWTALAPSAAVTSGLSVAHITAVRAATKAK